MFAKWSKYRILISAYVPFAMVDIIFPTVNANTATEAEEEEEEARLFCKIALLKPENARIKTIFDKNNLIVAEY